MHQFVSKVLPGMFMGPALNAGGSYSGYGSFFLTMPPSDLHIKRFNARRTKTCKKDSCYPPLCAKRWSDLEARTSRNASREKRCIYSIPDDDLDCEAIVNDARRKLEMRRASAMLCKVTTATSPERFKLGATLCKWLV